MVNKMGRKPFLKDRAQVIIYLSGEDKRKLHEFCRSLEPAVNLSAFIRWSIKCRMQELGYEDEIFTHKEK